MCKIVVIYGLPCTGKTMVSNYLARLTKIDDIIRIDDIWESKIIEPKYTVDESQIVFAELLKMMTSSILSINRLILIEGVFASQDRLEKLQNVVELHHCSMISILLFNDIHNLITLNSTRNMTLKNIIPTEVLENLNSKFNSHLYCDISINTGKISFNQAAVLINNHLCDGN